MADSLETLALMGSGVKAGAQIGGGIAAKNAGNFEAAQYAQNAADARAAGQRSGFEEAGKTAALLGKQKAIAAASGAAVASPSILDIMGDTAQRGKYLQEAEVYKGEARARDDMNRAAAAKMKGKNAEIGSILEGVGTMATGVGKYGPAIRARDASASGPVDGPLTLLDDESDADTGWNTKTRRFG